MDLVFPSIYHLQSQSYLNANQSAIDLCMKGDRKAQYEVYRQYAKAMFNICVRIIGREDEAEDVLQEAFLKAFSKIDTYKGTSAFGAWLKKIVVNEAINYVKTKKMAFMSIEDSGFDVQEESKLDEMQLVMQIEQIRKAIQLLPDGFRIVFSLYLLEGYDHNEISDILGISVSTSKSQYNRAKVKLKDILKERKF
ncbi:MAG: RNA polymerase sigma factor [Bacteroidetes bacterium]|nr:MAG: RNA polymerase sigma factor [Bacteroidota bacterium]